MTTTQPATNLYKRLVDSKHTDEYGVPCPRAAAKLASSAIVCPHGADICTSCDPCTCGRCEESHA